MCRGCGDLSDASEVRLGIIMGRKGDSIECAGVAATCLMPARRWDLNRIGSKRWFDRACRCCGDLSDASAVRLGTLLGSTVECPDVMATCLLPAKRWDLESKWVQKVIRSSVQALQRPVWCESGETWILLGRPVDSGVQVLWRPVWSQRGETWNKKNGSKIWLECAGIAATCETWNLIESNRWLECAGVARLVWSQRGGETWNQSGSKRWFDRVCRCYSDMSDASAVRLRILLGRTVDSSVQVLRRPVWCQRGGETLNQNGSKRWFDRVCRCCGDLSDASEEVRVGIKMGRKFDSSVQVLRRPVWCQGGMAAKSDRGGTLMRACRRYNDLSHIILCQRGETAKSDLIGNFMRLSRAGVTGQRPVWWQRGGETWNPIGSKCSYDCAGGTAGEEVRLPNPIG